jgi:hypothetical protein
MTKIRHGVCQLYLRQNLCSMFASKIWRVPLNVPTRLRLISDFHPVENLTCITYA